MTQHAAGATAEKRRLRGKPLGEEVTMTFLRYFCYIVAAALLASVVGGLFACAVAFVSPEFVKGLFTPPQEASLVRYAAAVGMVWGVFLGAASMGLSLVLATAVQVARLLKRKSDEQDHA
jgi:predicted lysophospholipase L1 biosynthesis ABC-type transport system permease subunit